MALYEPTDFKKYFYACVILAIFCLIGAIIAIGSSGVGSQFINKLSGDGVVEQRTQIGGVNEVVSGTGKYSYALTATWDDGTPLKFDSNVLLDVSVPVKGRLVSNTYSISVYNDATGYKHKMEATKVSGNFTGRSEIVSSQTSLESMIFMDGNATFRGRLVNATTGKHPTTESETYAVGIAVIDQYFQTDDLVPITSEEAWLEFCATWNGYSPLPPEGIYILPDGYELVDGRLEKIRVPVNETV